MDGDVAAAINQYAKGQAQFAGAKGGAASEAKKWKQPCGVEAKESW